MTLTIFIDLIFQTIAFPMFDEPKVFALGQAPFVSRTTSQFTFHSSTEKKSYHSQILVSLKGRAPAL